MELNSRAIGIKLSYGKSKVQCSEIALLATVIEKTTVGMMLKPPLLQLLAKQTFLRVLIFLLCDFSFLIQREDLLTPRQDQ